MELNMMKNFSINNGISLIDINNLTMTECIFIADEWKRIIKFINADSKRLGIVNYETKIINTDTLKNKIEYIRDYLLYGSYDLIIG
jgi:hypothetical protein